MNRKLFLALFLIVTVYVLLAQFLFSTSGTLYRSYSPDGQYSVYASSYHYMMFIPAMPGSGGDAPGKLYLYDEIEKEVIATAKIEMMNTTSDIRWGENTAYYVGEDEPTVTKPWKLPRPIGESKK